MKIQIYFFLNKYLTQETIILLGKEWKYYSFLDVFYRNKDKGVRIGIDGFLMVID